MSQGRFECCARFTGTVIHASSSSSPSHLPSTQCTNGRNHGMHSQSREDG